MNLKPTEQDEIKREYFKYLPGTDNIFKLFTSMIIDSQIESNHVPATLKLVHLTTKPAKLKSIRYEYISEITRVLSEIKLVISLIENKPSDEQFKLLQVTPKTFYVCLQGVFGELVHALRDKLLNFLYALSFNFLDDYNTACSSNPKVKKTLELALVKQLKIEGELNQWADDAKTLIGNAIRTRTGHHHGISGLSYNEELSKIEFEWISRNPQMQDILNEYGKNQIKKMADEAYEKWHSETINKLTKTKEEIEKNLNLIADKILSSTIDIPKSMGGYIREFPEYFKSV